jgi:hypothetical protein
MKEERKGTRKDYSVEVKGNSVVGLLWEHENRGSNRVR